MNSYTREHPQPLKFRGVFRLLTVCLFCLSSPKIVALSIATGDIDDRQYHYQELDNGLKVLLVSDPDTDKAAAALNVDVGNYNDPWERQGLAHFLEHMLFLGTKKYPEADEYQGFINSHGGSNNAYTSRHDTNYYFDIDAKSLEPTLDRFAQFFIAPLFNEFYVERERRAVYSEFQASLRDDYRRSFDVYRDIINPEHPDAKFSVGNLDTLADRPDDKVRDALLAFYETHYSADNMALVVTGKESIEQLQEMVLPRFGLILRNTITSAPSLEKKSAADETQEKIPLFTKNQLPVEVVLKPIKELRQMTLSFQLPGTRLYYGEKPLEYIGNLLGHEGRGSLMALLKREGLAEGLSAGGYAFESDRSVFSITLKLTEAGLREREHVKALVFRQIQQIRYEGLERWRFEEQKLLAEMAFNFREQGNAISTVRNLASRLSDYPPAEVISSAYLIQRFDPDLIRKMLALMTPDRALVTVTDPELMSDQLSTYYQTPYRVQKIRSKQTKIEPALAKELQLPAANPFVPQSTELFAKDVSLQTPKRLKEGALELWASQDLQFGVPRAQAMIRIESPQVSGNLKGVVLNAIYKDLLEDQLNEVAYEAMLAGISLSLQAHSQGLDIITGGYHDKLHRLMERLATTMEGASFSEDRFLQLRKDLLRDWRNRSKNTPYRQLYRQLAVNLNNSLWSDSDKIETLESISFSDLQHYALNWRKGANVDAFLYGNINSTWIKPWQESIANLIEGDSLALQPTRIAEIPKRSAYQHLHPIDHNDEAVILYVQGESDSLDDQAAMTLLQQVMRAAFYSSLRTEQQLGYIVFMSNLRLQQVPGSVFVVQSPDTSVTNISLAIEQFLKDFDSRFPDDIGVYQQAVATRLLEKPTSLSASAMIYWGDLLQDYENFDYRQQLVARVKSITADQLYQYYQANLRSPGRWLWQLSQQPEKSLEHPVWAGPAATKKGYVYP